MFNSLNSRLENTQLPIVEQLDQIRHLVSINPNVVLQADPGAGKTTLVPLALLQVISEDKTILVLEPRRLAARNAALRMAELLGEPVGDSVGYRIRNDISVSKKTRIEVITEGILTRMLQSDPELKNVGLIIFDEFHERNLDADLGLAFSIEVQQNLRDDLKILIMSATLETETIAQLLDGAPIIKSEGRSFPVEIQYLPPKKNFDWSSCLVKALQKIIQTDNNHSNHNQQDILVFLPGLAEIKRATQLINEVYSDEQTLVVQALYGDLPFPEQQKVLLPTPNKQKIILSTNIAESSVTIEGVSWVIDSGLMRQSAFDPNVGFSRLQTKKISQASAVQRCGRAGRLGPGYCYRLWSESDSLRHETQPAILQEDLTNFTLELAQWGIHEPTDLKLLNQPNQGIFKQSQVLLQTLRAIDQNNRITPHGKLLLSLGIHPRIAHMLIESIQLKASKLACVLAAMLEEKDLLQKQQRNDPDFITRVNCMFDDHYTSHTKKQITRQSALLLKKLKRMKVYQTSCQYDVNDCQHLIAPLLALVFPDRIAKKRGKGYRLANGSGAVLDYEFSNLGELLVIIRLGGGGSLPKIFQAASLEIKALEDYFPNEIIEVEEVEWEDKTQSVKAVLHRKFGELVLQSRQLTNPSVELVLSGLLKGITKKGIASLPWNKELRQWQSRVQLLRLYKPFDTQFNDLSDKTLLNSLENWLAPYLSGLFKFSQITTEILTQALKNHLDWSLQKKLDELMPLTIKVASGSNIKLDYLQGEKPVLAVKLQEMFGEKKTPKIAGGNISVVIHLLSPARLPLQITEDLGSFWLNGYVDVRKQMKGKYPRHPWPDNPLQAVATAYTKKRLKKEQLKTTEN